MRSRSQTVSCNIVEFCLTRPGGARYGVPFVIVPKSEQVGSIPPASHHRGYTNGLHTYMKVHFSPVLKGWTRSSPKKTEKMLRPVYSG